MMEQMQRILEITRRYFEVDPQAGGRILDRTRRAVDLHQYAHLRIGQTGLSRAAATSNDMEQL